LKPGREILLNNKTKRTKRQPLVNEIEKERKKNRGEGKRKNLSLRRWKQQHSRLLKSRF
jgi:hypothetical protein